MSTPITYCTVDKCTTRVHGHGLCAKHYARLQRHGSVADLPRGIKPKTLGKCLLCDKDAVAKDYCSLHHKQQILNGPNRPICSVDHCSRSVMCKYLCEYHYNLKRKTGSTTEPIRLTPEERFWSKVNKSSGQFFDGIECWNWTDTPDKYGYGSFGIEAGNMMKAYRYSYIIHNSVIDRNTHVHHKCQNKLCVNPAHLEGQEASDHVYITWIETLRKMGYTVIPPT